MKTLLILLISATTVFGQVYITPPAKEIVRGIGMANVVVACDDFILSEEEKVILQPFGFAYEKIGVSADGSRIMVSLLMRYQDTNSLLAKFAGYHPVVVGAWEVDGYKLNPFNRALWISMTPKEPIMTGEGINMTLSGWRTVTELKQIHLYAGWAERNFDE